MGGILSRKDGDDSQGTASGPTLEQKINQYAADLILRSSFRDMKMLMRKEECDKLVILTSKVIDQNFRKADISVMQGKIDQGQPANKSVEFIKETELRRESGKRQEEKARLCDGLARYYVKIAHLFAAISQTVDPTYVYKVGGPRGTRLSPGLGLQSSRLSPAQSYANYLSPYDPRSPVAQSPAMQSPVMQSPDMQSPVMQSPVMQSPAMQSPGMQSPGMQSPGMQSPGMQSPVMQSPVMQSPVVQSPGMQSPVVQHANGSAWATPRHDAQSGGMFPAYAPGYMTSPVPNAKGEIRLKWNQLRNLDAYENTQFVKTELNGFCSERLATLDPSGVLQAPKLESLFEIKPAVCGSNRAYPDLERVGGIPDLIELYRDVYDPGTKQYSGMSARMSSAYRADLASFYKVFTGNKVVPDDIKSFADIKLTDYSKLRGCDKESAQFPKKFDFKDGVVHRNNEGDTFFTPAQGLTAGQRPIPLDEVTVRGPWPDGAKLKVLQHSAVGEPGSRIQLWGKLSDRWGEFGEEESQRDLEIVFINEPSGLLRRGQTGTLKMKLFSDYANKVREMVRTSRENRDKLLAILEKIFTTATADGSTVVRINDDLTEASLDELIAKTRDTIVGMYISCEKGFKEALAIFDAIIDKLILDQSVSIGEQLEERMNEYVGSEQIDLDAEATAALSEESAPAEA